MPESVGINLAINLEGFEGGEDDVVAPTSPAENLLPKVIKECLKASASSSP